MLSDSTRSPSPNPRAAIRAAIPAELPARTRARIERWADSREPTPFDLELAALSVQLRQERRTLLARGVGELFEDDSPRGAA